MIKSSNNRCAYRFATKKLKNIFFTNFLKNESLVLNTNKRFFSQSPENEKASVGNILSALKEMTNKQNIIQFVQRNPYFLLFCAVLALYLSFLTFEKWHENRKISINVI